MLPVSRIQLKLADRSQGLEGRPHEWGSRNPVQGFRSMPGVPSAIGPSLPGCTQALSFLSSSSSPKGQLSSELLARAGELPAIPQFNPLHLPLHGS